MSPVVKGNQNSTEAHHTKAQSATTGVYMGHGSLFEAAEAVSAGLSSAIRQMSGFGDQRSGMEGQSRKELRRAKKTISFHDESKNLRKEKPSTSFVGNHCQAIPTWTKTSGNGSSHKTSPRPSTSSSGEDVLPEGADLPTSGSSLKRKSSLSRRPRFSNKDDKSPYNSPPPMARMRDVLTQQLLITKEPRGSSVPHTPKTHEQVKAEKQRKWKTKLKQAQEKKMQERRILDGGSNIRRDAVVDGKQLANLVGIKVLDLIGQCGVIDEIPSDSDFSIDEGSGDDENSQESSSTNDSKRKSQSTGNIEAQRNDPNGEIAKSTEAIKNGDATPAITPERVSKTGEVSESTPPLVQISPDTELLGSIVSPVGVRSPVSANTGESQFLGGQNLSFPHLTPTRRSVSSPSKKDLSKSPIPRGSPGSKSCSSATMNPQNKDFVKAFVHDMVQIGFVFFWHKEKASISPASVTIRLQPGYRTSRGTYCGPSLVWEESEFESYGIDLFDIRNLERANTSQLKDYPYSMPRRTIFLRTSREHDFIFEGKTDDDAFRFVHGMRWMIARLSFNLVIGNIDVGCELLELRQHNYPAKQPHFSIIEEARRAKAMDDLTDQLIEQSVFGHFL